MKNSIAFLLILGCLYGCSSGKTKKKANFNKEQIALILKDVDESPMRVFKITNKTDSILLRTKSTYVKPDSTDVVLQRFVNRLYATVRDSLSMGVGIAAPQVGVLKNIIWVQRFDKENLPFEVYLNPKIINYSTEKQTYREGCLSIPNRSELLDSRSKTIIIEYDTMKEEHKTDTISGFTAVIFQHEIDHLNGILYLDHLNQEVKDVGLIKKDLKSK